MWPQDTEGSSSFILIKTGTMTWVPGLVKILKVLPSVSCGHSKSLQWDCSVLFMAYLAGGLPNCDMLFPLCASLLFVTFCTWFCFQKTDKVSSIILSFMTFVSQKWVIYKFLFSLGCISCWKCNHVSRGKVPITQHPVFIAVHLYSCWKASTCFQHNGIGILSSFVI